MVLIIFFTIALKYIYYFEISIWTLHWLE